MEAKSVMKLAAVAVMCALPILCPPTTRAQTFFPPAVSLASLTNGGTVLVGDKLFSDFGITGYDAGSVTVEGMIQNGNYGIQFGGSIAANDASLSLSLSYQVNVTNSTMLIAGANLTFNGVVVGGPGQAQVVENIYTNGSDLYGQMEVSTTQSTQTLSTNLMILPPQAQLNLDNDVLVSTVSLPAFSSISTINETYMQVPEPSAVALVGMGLIGALTLRRRRR
jgi:PEP-CTERM motif